MIYLSDLQQITESKYEVGYIHYMPFDKEHGLDMTREELEQEGILVDSVPEPEHIDGKSAVLYCNPETKELWFEYADIPKTPEQIQAEKIDLLENQTAEAMVDLDFRLSNIELGL